MRTALFTLLSLTAGIVSACSSPSSASTASDLSALTATTDDGGVPETLAPCLTTYVECIRATPGDVATCQSALRACVVPPRHDGDAHDGGPGSCNHPGGGERPGPGGAHDHGPPGPRPEDGGARPAPPDGGMHQAPPDDGAHAGGPKACLDALDTCAAGTGTAASCATDALTCLAKLR